MDNRLGAIQIDALSVVVERFDEHRRGTHEVGPIDGAPILEHVGAQAKWRGDVWIVGPQLTGCIAIGSQDWRHGDSDGILHGHESATVFQSIDRAIDRSRPLGRIEITDRRIDEQRLQREEADAEILVIRSDVRRRVQVVLV